MTPEDLAEMRRRLSQEELLIRHGFEPVPENGGELWISCLPGGEPELWTRARALEELTALDRGSRSFKRSLTRLTLTKQAEERSV